MGTKDDAVRVALGRHFEQHGDVHDCVPFRRPEGSVNGAGPSHAPEAAEGDPGI
jgi:hypothetical protein